MDGDCAGYRLLKCVGNTCTNPLGVVAGMFGSKSNSTKTSSASAATATTEGGGKLKVMGLGQKCSTVISSSKCDVGLVCSSMFGGACRAVLGGYCGLDTDCKSKKCREGVCSTQDSSSSVVVDDGGSEGIGLENESVVGGKECEDTERCLPNPEKWGAS